MYKQLEYLYLIRKYIFVATGIFIASLTAGLIISESFVDFSKNYYEDMINSFSWIKDINPSYIVFIIFLNNSIKSLIMLLLGLGFGIAPILFLVSNGIVIAIISNIVSKQQGVLFVILALLPHGIIEIPMILLSAGIGLRLGHVVYKSSKGETSDIKGELIKGTVFYFKIILPLLFVAALIETYITPLIIFIIT